MSVERKQVESSYQHWSKHPSFVGISTSPIDYPLVKDPNFYRGKQEKDAEKNAFSEWRKSLNKK